MELGDEARGGAFDAAKSGEQGGAGGSDGGPGGAGWSQAGSESQSEGGRSAERARVDGQPGHGAVSVVLEHIDPLGRAARDASLKDEHGDVVVVELVEELEVVDRVFEGGEHEAGGGPAADGVAERRSVDLNVGMQMLEQGIEVAGEERTDRMRQGRFTGSA